MSENKVSPRGSSWAKHRDEIFNSFTEEEKKEINARVEFMNQLIEIRNNDGISQRELEELSGISQSVITRTETQETNPRLDTILKLLTAMGYKLKIVPLDETA